MLCVSPELLKAPIFLVGYPRSGTTLLRAMLGAHPAITMVNEPEIVYGLLAGGYTLSSTFPVGQREAVLEKLRAFKLARNHLEALPPGVVEAFCRHPKAMTFQEVYEHLLFATPPTAVWGEKSLNNSFLIPHLARLYPQALFLFIIRDARTTVYSNYRKGLAYRGQQGEANLGDTPHRDMIRVFTHEALKWVAWVEQTRAYGQQLARGHFMEVRYEDLLTEPQRVLSGICERVGVPWDRRMLATDVRGRDPVLTQPSALIHQKLAEPLDPAKAKEHEQMAAWANGLVERYAGPLLSQYGYPLVAPRVPLPARVRCAAVTQLYQRRIRRSVGRFLASRHFEPAAPQQPQPA